jgi:hypothetical protein
MPQAFNILYQNSLVISCIWITPNPYLHLFLLLYLPLKLSTESLFQQYCYFVTCPGIYPTIFFSIFINPSRKEAQYIHVLYILGF